MGLLLMVVIGWALLTALGVIGAAAVCRSGHAEDVARGFVDESPASRDEVTHR
ncbi:MAG: hypothetical protein JWO22_172 [Frankiales bacterium]|nr:hypothetical protein [Frankiales bacterium]